MATLTDALTTIRLDVRPMLAEGREPFSTIMEAADRVMPGGTLELLAPFEPRPLFRAMRQRGFAHAAEPMGNDWVIRFRRLDIRPDSTLQDVYRRFPATGAVLTAIGAELCCGGAVAISKLAEAHGVALDRLLSDLQAAAIAE